jgi:hypothetical protein
MAINLANKTRVTPPAPPFPFGNIKDTTPSDKGTPVNVETYGDFHQFFAKMADLSGITLNDLPDNDTNSYQYVQAMLNVINQGVGKAFVLSQIGTYTANDLIILFGCAITPTIPGLSSITAGAIYYNDYIYYVPSGFVNTAPGETLVYKIDESVTPKFMFLDNGISGTGIADYNDATVKPLHYFTNVVTDIFTSASFTSSASDASIDTIQAKKIGRLVTLDMSITQIYKADTGGGDTVCDFIFKPGFIPNPSGSYQRNFDAIITDGSLVLQQIRVVNMTIIGFSNIFRIYGNNTNNGGAYNRQAKFNLSITYETIS